MITQMTRAEYEKLYGVKPVFSATSTLEDETPAPMRMTRAEYEEMYYPTQTKQDGLGSKLVNRAKDVGDALWADKPSDLAPGRTALRIGGAVTGAAADVIGAALSPAIGKLVDTVSNISAVQRFAMKKGTSKALDVANVATEVSQEEWKKFEEKNPVIAQDIRDVTNIASFIPVGKGVQVAGKGVAKATEGIVPKVAKNLDERGVKNVVDEIAKIEDKYGKTRNANLYSKDVEASRARIAESNVLDGAVDTDGVIRTKTPGGVIDQYKAQTIDGLEDIVRKGLKESKETIPVTLVRQALVREIGKSGLEGADLVTALKKIDKELEGLDVRIKGSSIIDLSYLHDAKIATTKNINYMTPPEKSTYRKAVARAYKTLVEENSQKVDVKAINKELSTYYDDIKRLERLDGARAEGGRLGKYTASVAGTLIGGAAGSAGGGIGAAVGGIVGGEAAAALKGLGMSRTFKGGGKGLPKSAVLEKARLSIPDRPMKGNLKKGVEKTKEVTKLEKDIAKNVADQKKAIAKGDFALVAALKEVYTVLVEELKKAIKYLNENASVGMSIKKTVTPESVAKRADEADMGVLDYVIRDYDNAILDPVTNRTLNDMGLGKATREERIAFAKEVFDEQAGVGGKVTVEKDLSAQPADASGDFGGYYHGSANVIDGELRPSEAGILGKGFYVTKDPKVAENFAQTRNLPLAEQLDGLQKITDRSIKPNLYEVDTSKVKLKELGNADGLMDFLNGRSIDEARKELLAQGFDGIALSKRGESVIFPESMKKIKTTLKTPSNPTDPTNYKSAEEFVKAQGTPVYHGTGVKFDNFDDSMRGSLTGAKSAKGAIWFTDDNATAKAYSIYSAEEAVVKKALAEADALEKIAQKSGKNADWKKYDAKIAEMEDLAKYDNTFNRREQANVKEVIIDGDLYEVDAKGKSPQELSSGENIDSWLDEQLQEAKRLGKDGVKITNLDDAVGLYNRPATHYAIFDSKKIKTKSQLTEIWNKANRKASATDK